MIFAPSNTAGNEKITLTNTAGTAADAIGITATAGSIDMNAGGAITLDSAAASNFTTSSGALTLDGAAGVNIAGNASEVDITTTGAVDINSGVFTLDTTGAASHTVEVDITKNIDVQTFREDVGIWKRMASAIIWTGSIYSVILIVSEIKVLSRK
mgnify:CR=1 FL=1